MAQVLFDPQQELSNPWELVGRMRHASQEADTALDPRHRTRLGVVSDLDDTAFQTAFRTARLFEWFVRSTRLPDTLSPDLLVREVYELANEGRMPYKVGDILNGQLPPEVAAAWFPYWRTHFFTDRAVQHDLPQAVIRSLLQLLVRQGLPVGYLTGRHLPSQHADPYPAGMVEGTLLTLWKHDFPHGPVTFKPGFRLADHEFKGGYFSACTAEDETSLIPVGYLDNEPGVVNLHDTIMDGLGIPHVSVWFQTVHAPLSEDLRLRPEVLVLKP